MRICYIVPLELNKLSGVLKKIRCQVMEWIKSGHDVQVFYISITTPTVEVFAWEKVYSANKDRSNEFTRMYWRSFFCYKIRDVLKKNKPDVLYFRYVFWFPSITRLLLENKSFVELNSHDLNEFSNKNVVLGYFYKKIRKIIFRSAYGVIGVSEDICTSLCGYASKIYLLANGYNFNLSVKRSENICRGNNIVFVSSPNQYWQGLDIIVSLMHKLPLYRLHIIGWSEINFKAMYKDIIIPQNVLFLGYKSESDVDSILNDMHYAFNAMAMYRKGMNYNSALKTAQYLNANLPIISGYIETGIVNDAILYLDPKNIAVNVDRLMNFIRYWANKSVDIIDVHSQLGCEKIEQERLKIFMD